MHTHHIYVFLFALLVKGRREQHHTEGLAANGGNRHESVPWGLTRRDLPEGAGAARRLAAKETAAMQWPSRWWHLRYDEG